MILFSSVSEIIILEWPHYTGFSGLYRNHRKNGIRWSSSGRQLIGQAKLVGGWLNGKTATKLRWEVHCSRGVFTDIPGSLPMLGEYQAHMGGK